MLLIAIYLGEQKHFYSVLRILIHLIFKNKNKKKKQILEAFYS